MEGMTSRENDGREIARKEKEQISFEERLCSRPPAVCALA